MARLTTSWVAELTSSKTTSRRAVESPEKVAEKKRMNKYRWKLIAGLFGPFALQAFDTTVVASALPTISREFAEIKQLNWIISSFNLASAAFLFFWAQVTDVFGRHLAVQAAIIVMMIGSAICTGAPTSSFPVFLLGRSIQGIGCSGVNISIRTILADKVSLEDFAQNWTSFVLISGVAFGVGPLIGGYLTTVSWRWCFAINLPICVASVILIFFLLRNELLGPQPVGNAEGGSPSTRSSRLQERLLTIDFGGQALFLFGLGLVILGLTWAGATYSWSSVNVLAPLLIGAALTACWVFYERSLSSGGKLSRVFPNQKAMIPWTIITDRDNCLVFFVNFTSGMAMFAVMYFLSLYFTLVDGDSSDRAGLKLLYYMPGLSAGVFVAIFATKKWPRQTFPVLVLGSVVTAVGMTVLTWAVHARNDHVVYGMMALIGLGVMLRMNPAVLHCLAYFPDLTARITCLNAFAIPFGGLFALTIMSTVFNNKIDHGNASPQEAIMWAFVSMIPFMWLCVACCLCIGNVWILKDGAHEVLRGSYLLHLLTGKMMVTDTSHRGEDNAITMQLDERMKVGEV